mmetsp:Transcript_51069/g.150575  ORF Transcript_51069/g.150575 Transcript_51069/m.150575 type:complete len:210 (-) Transcript_51069:647-1276(-)
MSAGVSDGVALGCDEAVGVGVSFATTACRPPPFISRPPPGLLPKVLTQIAMWRSPASLLKVRPQCGHFVVEESVSPAALSVFWMALALTCASSSPASARAARMAWRKAKDSFFHFGMALPSLPPPPPFALDLVGLSTALPPAILAALAMSSPAFSRSPSRFAALLNCLRFCWKTFLQILMCLSRLSILNCLPHSRQGTRRPSSTPPGNS